MLNTTASEFHSTTDRRHRKQFSNPSSQRDNTQTKLNRGSNLDRTPESHSSSYSKPFQSDLDLNLTSSSNQSQRRRFHTPKTAQSHPPSAPSSQSLSSQPSTPKSRHRKPSNPPLSNASGVVEEEFSAAKFITVTQAIDPVRLIPCTSDATRTTIVHGANIYLEWIERSLRTYDEVTLVGVDQGIASTLSLVLMLDDAGIAIHHAAETFTTREASVFKSCILFRLHNGLKNRSKSLSDSLPKPG